MSLARETKWIVMRSPRVRVSRVPHEETARHYDSTKLRRVNEVLRTWVRGQETVHGQSPIQDRWVIISVQNTTSGLSRWVKTQKTSIRQADSSGFALFKIRICSSKVLSADQRSVSSSSPRRSGQIPFCSLKRLRSPSSTRGHNNDYGTQDHHCAKPAKGLSQASSPVRRGGQR